MRMFRRRRRARRSGRRLGQPPNAKRASGHRNHELLRPARDARPKPWPPPSNASLRAAPGDPNWPIAPGNARHRPGTPATAGATADPGAASLPWPRAPGADGRRSLSSMLASTGFACSETQVDLGDGFPTASAAVFSRTARRGRRDLGRITCRPPPRASASRRRASSFVHLGCAAWRALRIHPAQTGPARRPVGETLRAPVPVAASMLRDRAPSVALRPGATYILPASEGAALPLVAVNTDLVGSAALCSVRPQTSCGPCKTSIFGQPLRDCSSTPSPARLAEVVWEGAAMSQQGQNRLGRGPSQPGPPMGAALGGLPPGLYALEGRAWAGAGDSGSLCHAMVSSPSAISACRP